MFAVPYPDHPHPLSMAVEPHLQSTSTTDLHRHGTGLREFSWHRFFQSFATSDQIGVPPERDVVEKQLFAGHSNINGNLRSVDCGRDRVGVSDSTRLCEMIMGAAGRWKQSCARPDDVFRNRADRPVAAPHRYKQIFVVAVRHGCWQ